MESSKSCFESLYELQRELERKIEKHQPSGEQKYFRRATSDRDRIAAANEAADILWHHTLALVFEEIDNPKSINVTKLGLTRLSIRLVEVEEILTFHGRILEKIAAHTQKETK